MSSNQHSRLDGQKVVAHVGWEKLVEFIGPWRNAHRSEARAALTAIEQYVASLEEQYESRTRELFGTGEALANADREIARLKEQVESLQIELHAAELDRRGAVEQLEAAYRALRRKHVLDDYGITFENVREFDRWLEIVSSDERIAQWYGEPNEQWLIDALAAVESNPATESAGQRAADTRGPTGEPDADSVPSTISSGSHRAPTHDEGSRTLRGSPESSPASEPKEESE